MDHYDLLQGDKSKRVKFNQLWAICGNSPKVPLDYLMGIVILKTVQNEKLKYFKEARRLLSTFFIFLLFSAHKIAESFA